jgi:hypothetical protein
MTGHLPAGATSSAFIFLSNRGGFFAIGFSRVESPARIRFRHGCVMLLPFGAGSLDADQECVPIAAGEPDIIIIIILINKSTPAFPSM